jgi:DNA invertase Pin-like site-specific DNA recombinase
VTEPRDVARPQTSVGFCSLKDARCDTTTPHGVPMLTVLGGLAEFEPTLIKARTGEGQERARGRGGSGDLSSSALIRVPSGTW